MTLRDRPPFRADHVGSLLRPARLVEARERHAKGEIDEGALRAVEDDSIREVVKLQEDIGLHGITDGEYRRASWSSDFLRRIEGVAVTEGKFVSSFRRADGVDVSHRPPTMVVAGKLRNPGGIQLADFTFLKSVTQRTPKVCIPSPSMLHFRGGREAIDRVAYPDMEGFFADLAKVYNDEIQALARAGARYVQLDDTNFAYLCDPRIREATKKLGEDPDVLPRRYCRLINESIRGRPDDMVVTVHMCRGNFRSAWVAEGGYDPVAEVLFNELAVDGLFMEYDDPRSGGFAPLRFVPKGKTVVLGLLTTKRAALESADEISRRIDEAAAYVPLDQLALSPQCGFSSTVHGNELTVDDEIAKLRRIVELAEAVWG
ncbi:MAG: 5-methyltetrahydropteroyltriglutamate--homocysteine S-methyltransferase [Rhodospirillaceae bacterium]